MLDHSYVPLVSGNLAFRRNDGLFDVGVVLFDAFMIAGDDETENVTEATCADLRNELKHLSPGWGA